MLTKKQMCDSIIRMFGFEHEITVAFFSAVTLKLPMAEPKTAYEKAEKIFREMQKKA